MACKNEAHFLLKPNGTVGEIFQPSLFNQCRSCWHLLLRSAAITLYWLATERQPPSHVIFYQRLEHGISLYADWDRTKAGQMEPLHEVGGRKMVWPKRYMPSLAAFA